MIRPLPTENDAVVQKPICLEMTLSGFSVTQHSGDHVIFGRGKPNHSGNLVSGSRVIFGRKWPYHFGRKRPWPTQKTFLRRKHCVKTLCWLGDTKTFFQYIWKTEKSFLFHKSKKNKKKRSIRLFVPNKRKNEKRRCTRLSIIRRWLNCSLSNYSPPAVFGTETRMQLFFHVCPFFESGCNSRGLWFLVDFSIIKATYQLL